MTIWSRCLEAFLLTLFSLAAPFTLLTSKGRRWWRLQLDWTIPDVNWEDKTVVWIHAASRGEVEMARPLLAALAESSPNHVALLTYSSPSAHQRAQELSQQFRCLSFVLPVVWWNPQLSLLWTLPVATFFLMKNDLYPHLQVLLSRRSCTRVWLGCHLTRKPPWKHRRLLRFFNRVSCVDETSRNYAERYLRVGGRATIDGDLKWQAVSETEGPLLPSQPYPGTWVLGSVWPADWRQLAPALSDPASGWKNLVIVPHEPHARVVKQLEAQCRAQFPEAEVILNTPELSELSLVPEQKRIFIVSEVGVLKHLYAVAELAFVGGAFHHRVHNVCEPIRFGVPTLVGPRIEHSPEVSLLAQEGCVHVCRESGDILTSLRYALNPSQAAASRRKGPEWLGLQRGVARRIVSHLSR